MDITINVTVARFLHPDGTQQAIMNFDGQPGQKFGTLFTQDEEDPDLQDVSDETLFWRALKRSWLARMDEEEGRNKNLELVYELRHVRDINQKRIEELVAQVDELEGQLSNQAGTIYHLRVENERLQKLNERQGGEPARMKPAPLYRPGPYEVDTRQWCVDPRIGAQPTKTQGD